MASPYQSVSLPQLPQLALEHIIRCCQTRDLGTLRLSCKTLRHTITPSAILLSYTHRKQCALKHSRSLASKWPTVTHAVVVGQAYRDVIDVDLSQSKMERLLLFFNASTTALMYWTQLQSVLLPVFSPLLSTLLAVGGQLKRVELCGDRMFCGDIFSEKSGRHQLGTCLHLLERCTALRTLKLDLGASALELELLRMLGCLHQLESLELMISRTALVEEEDEDEDEVVDVNVNHIVSSLSTLTGLRGLTLDLRWFEVGNVIMLPVLPHLRDLTISIHKDDYSSSSSSSEDEDKDLVFCSGVFAGCAQVESLVVKSGRMSAGALRNLRHLRHVELAESDLDDNLVTVLQSSPLLESLKVCDMIISAAVVGNLPVLRDLRVADTVVMCQVPFYLLAPKLTHLKCDRWADGDKKHLGMSSVLESHSSLRSLQMALYWLTEGAGSTVAAALASLTALDTLRVNRIGKCGGRHARVQAWSPKRFGFSEMLVGWAAGLKALHLEGQFEQLPAEQLLMMLKAMPNLHSLCLRDEAHQDSEERREFKRKKAVSKVAGMLAWVIGACVRGMQDLRFVEVDVRLLVSSDWEEEGGLPLLTAVLVSLAAAPHLVAVRLVDWDGGFKDMKEGFPGLELFRSIQNQVGVVRLLETLHYHVEVA